MNSDYETKPCYAKTHRPSRVELTLAPPCRMDTIPGRSSQAFLSESMATLSLLPLGSIQNGEIPNGVFTKPTWFYHKENLLWKKRPSGIPKHKHINTASDQTSP